MAHIRNIKRKTPLRVANSKIGFLIGVWLLLFLYIAIVILTPPYFFESQVLSCAISYGHTLPC